MFAKIKASRLNFYSQIERDLEELTKLIPLSELTFVSGSPSEAIKAKALRHYRFTMGRATLEEKWLCFAEDLEGLPVMPDFED